MKRIGARIIKTGVAVAITMFVCAKLNLQPALFGALAAVINLQPTIYFSVKSSLEQIKTHAIGVLMGMLFGYLFGSNPLTMGLVAMLIIYLYQQLNLQNGILSGIVAAIFILSSPQDLFITNALSRTGVIFIGVIVSTAVNVFLWPPRYELKLLQKLREADIAVVNYFCHAVDDFVNLHKREPHSHDKERTALYSLLSEANILLDYIHDENKFRYNMQKLIDYIEGIAEKADRIYEIVPMRVERRAKYGNPPVTEEFIVILNHLASGCETIMRVNEDIRSVVCDNTAVNRQKIHEHYWTKLTQAIEEWQHNLQSSYFVHGLIDAAVVANEIRWTSREGKKLINSIIKTKEEI